MEAHHRKTTAKKGWASLNPLTSRLEHYIIYNKKKSKKLHCLTSVLRCLRDYNDIAKKGILG
jgi:hypothetical protein